MDRFTHSPDGTTDTSPETQQPSKRPRKQVSRACDLCRARRIRCDNGQPCRACYRRGVECTSRGDDEPRTLPAALRESEKLRQQVRELQEQLEALKLRQSTLPTPSGSQDHQRSPRDNTTVATPTTRRHTQTPQWVGVYVSVAGYDQLTYFGPTSLYYLVSRVGSYVRKTLQMPCPEQSIVPSGARKRPTTTTTTTTTQRNAEMTVVDRVRPRANTAGVITNGTANTNSGALTRAQEELVLQLFWEGHHCLIPVVDETAFRTHYASLWEPAGRTTRRNSPLVDIVLALCLQYGYSFIPKAISLRAMAGGNSSNEAGDDEADNDDNGNDNENETPPDNAAIAGRWYYLRSESLLRNRRERPNLQTVQCYILTAAYLCCASFHNMCHVMEAQAMRTAQMLGLHLEPPMDLPEAERELRRRVWWTLWLLEAKTSTKFSRPLVVDSSQIGVAYPSDDLPAAQSPTFAVDSGVTWLTFSRQIQQLYATAIDVYDALRLHCGQTLHDHGLVSLDQDAAVREECARFLASQLPAMQAWADNVPAGLHLCRRSPDARPLSTDRGALLLDPLAPQWRQRQAVCLELSYHTIMANLTRTFITFQGSSSASYAQTPMAARHATLAADHAIAYTRIMHHVATEADLLSGWTEFFSLQWNSAITLSAFVLAYPVHAATPRARAALDQAIGVFDHFGVHFAVSADAAAITRDLVNKADYLAGNPPIDDASMGSLSTMQQQQQPLPLPDELAVNYSSAAAITTTMTTTAAATPPTTTTTAPVGSTDMSWLGSAQDGTEGFNQFMDWAFSVDNFNSFERFFEANNTFDWSGAI